MNRRRTHKGQRAGRSLACEAEIDASDRIRAALQAAAKGSRAPLSGPRVYVSYAWNDNTPEGRAREAKVSELCQRSRDVVLRDREMLLPGDRITDFMRRLGDGDRVYIFLSDKYLKSAYCMFELCEIWRNCRQRDEEFLERTRVYVLECARIATISERASYAAYWRNEYERVEEAIRKFGSDIVGARGMPLHRDSQRYATEIADILTLIADVVRPESFETFLERGFS